MPPLDLVVNGERQRVDALAGEMLSDVLRDRLGLTGTKVACGEAECGACTVLFDGEPVLSCVMPAERAQGHEITTIEGLARGAELHPVQEAFVQHGAIQCGFCTPGQILSAVSLLAHSADPSEAEIRNALKDVLCRCGAYPRILAAIRAAAQSMRTGEPIEAPEIGTAAAGSVGGLYMGIGTRGKATGGAKFSDDYSFPGMLHGATLRAGVPHGILVRLDTRRAEALAGVRAVLTAADIPGEKFHGLIIPDWPVLVGLGERARYVGDALAVVAAEDRRTARRALDLIDFEIQPQPVISDPFQALAEGAAQLHPGGNLLKHLKVRKGDMGAGWGQAEVMVEEEYFTPTYEHAFMEPECSLARPVPGGRFEVYVGSQIPYEDRRQVAAALGLAQEQVRVIGTTTGGAFGGKEDIAGQIHAALLAQATGRAVKIRYDRRESMLAHPKRHATRIRVKLGAARDGRLVAAQAEIYGDTGAYASLGEEVMTRATTHATGPYAIPNIRVDCYAVYTNNPPAGAFRGFGVSQVCFAVESAIDTLAQEMGVDPLELRLKNALRAGASTSTCQILRESAGLTECIHRVGGAIRERRKKDGPFAPRPVEGKRHLRRAWGCAAAFKNTGLGGGARDSAGARIELFPDGSAEVRSSSADVGQGLGTVLQLIASQELRIPPHDIRVELSDTDRAPDGGPTTASRQTFMTGNAVRHAAIAMRRALISALAEHFDVPLEAIHFDMEAFQVDGRGVSLPEAVGILAAGGQAPIAEYEYTPPKTVPLGEAGDMHVAYSFAAQAAEVEVNLLTGEVAVLSVISAVDVGRAIHPLGLIGQIEGGVLMGIGNALTEEYILEEGQVVTDRLALYRIPSMLFTPEIVPIIVEQPAREGPYGAKGIGEITNIPTSPAITNAIYNACGVRVRRLPVDQDWLARELAAKGEWPDV